MTTTLAKVEISSNCECFTCNTCECGIIGGTEDGRCLDCGSELQSDTYCTGMCWEDANYSGEMVFDDYLKEYSQPQHLRIEGRRMGWMARSGYKDVKATWPALRDALMIDGEFRIVFKVEEGGIFTARRFSHDEPTGASFSIYPVKHIPDTMDLDDAIKLEIVDEYGCHKGCGNYFYDCECVVE